MKSVTIIIPCRNECNFIAKTLDSVFEQDYPKDFLEVLVIDGMSDDGTNEIIEQYCKKYKALRICKNPNKTVPHALNIGLENSVGEVIIRMDAHCIYPSNYISKLVFYLYELNADNVGGAWITIPGSKSKMAQSIALATSSIFGIGNARYRLTNDKIIEVDTVPFGCYKRSVFEKIGVFDEDMIRNQDDELNVRLKKHGGKIFLIPEIKIEYCARPDLLKTMKMFYQYGLFKPLVMKKVGQPASVRQFIPLALILLILCIPILFFIHSFLFKISVLILLLYLFLLIFFSILSSLGKSIKLFVLLAIVFATIHISYGWGYLSGIFRFIIFNHNSKEISLSR
jgi:glycosyltransferase involved in cell wall biosynthesis